MQQLIQVCIECFSYDKMEDILILVNYTAAQLKRQSLLITSQSLRQLFPKVSQVPVPVSNTSDIDKTLIYLNSLFIRFILTCLEEIGIDVLLNSDNSMLIEPMVDWLVVQFTQGVEAGDKKTILRILRYVFMGLRAIGPYGPKK